MERAMGRGILERILVVEEFLETFDYNVIGRLCSSTRLSNLCTERVSFKWEGYIGSYTLSGSSALRETRRISKKAITSIHGHQRKRVMHCIGSLLKLTFVLVTTGHSTPTWRED